VLVFYGAEADVEEWFAAIEALQATTITLTDDWEKEYENLFVVQVSERDKRPVLVLDDDDIDTRGEMRIEGVVRVISETTPEAQAT
jgi:hypothetical protein